MSEVEWVIASVVLVITHGAVFFLGRLAGRYTVQAWRMQGSTTRMIKIERR